MGKLMGKLVGDLGPTPAIANAEHDSRFAFGSALVEVHGIAMIGLRDQDGLKLSLGIITGNGHGGRIADYYKILGIRLETLVGEPDIKLGNFGRRRIVTGSKSRKGKETTKKGGAREFHFFQYNPD
jgi:hypothetical protein